MGCPNVVRGGSHLGWASAAAMAEAGVCSVLTSDYYYPAMLRAAFVLAERGVLDLPRAWALISENPARAAGLTDRGVIEAGKRADIVVVDPADVPGGGGGRRRAVGAPDGGGQRAVVGWLNSGSRGYLDQVRRTGVIITLFHRLCANCFRVTNV